MGVYSHLPNVTVRKLDLAKTQLEEAIGLFLAGKYVSALTLAGAADGIISEYLETKGIQSAADETWATIIRVRAMTGLAYGGTIERKEAYKLWNRDKNRAKHSRAVDEEAFEYNPFDSAYEMIQRANIDAKKAGVIADNLQEYENWLVENIYMESDFGLK